MKRPASLFVGSALASLVLAAVPASVAAECMNTPLRPSDHLDVSVAFLATVTKASDDVDPNPVANAWDWRVELDVKGTYLGTVPRSLAFNDYAMSCAGLNIGALQAGDEIIIATETMPMSYLPGAPFEGDFLIWHKTDHGWAFFEDALAYGSDRDFYPGPARSATTKADILRVISAASLPSTSMDSAQPERRGSDAALLTVMASFAAFVIAWSRFGRLHRGRDIARR